MNTIELLDERKCPQRQITECLGVKLKGFAILKHSKRYAIGL